MEYNILEKIIDKAYILIDRGSGREFNLLISEEYYNRFNKALEGKYSYYQGKKPRETTNPTYMTYVAMNGIKLHIVQTEDIKTFKVVAVDSGLPSKQDTDEDNGEVINRNPYGD